MSHLLEEKAHSLNEMLLSKVSPVFALKTKFSIRRIPVWFAEHLFEIDLKFRIIRWIR